MSENTINIIVADDHQMFLDGLRSLLKDISYINIIGFATHGQQVLDLLRYHSVDVVVLDVEMPVMDGVETSIRIKEHYPDVKILALTMYKEEGFVTRMVQAGISGYILKERSQEELVEAIKNVYQGHEHYDRKITNVIINSIKDTTTNKKTILTKSEIKVLTLIGKGLTTPEIANQLCISPNTVNTHRRNIIEKLGLPGGTKGLVKYAVENGYIK
ncbi:MAG: response regulator transcription factor [Microscillaceae bacterium]|nr:response regulator transcription factor [Microscillaceae bacterium]